MPTTIALVRPAELAPALKINLVTCFVLAWASAMLLVAIYANCNIGASEFDPFELIAMF